MRKFALTTCAVVLLTACRGGSASPETRVAHEVFPDSAARSSLGDDAARFLAGLPGRPGGSFEELERTSAWQNHRAELDRMWKNVDVGWVPAIRKFADAELTECSPPAAVVFYPFSGPDVLTLTAMFPANSTYVMVGLEPVGTLPSPRQMEHHDLEKRLDTVRDSVYSELHRSFFITREMDRQFRGQVSDGLLEPLLHLLVRTNHRILGYRYVRIAEDGRLQNADARATTSHRYRNSGVQIDVHSADDGRDHKWFYFSVNLADQRLTENNGFRIFLKSIEGMTTLLKATSYMPHKNEFSTIRNEILEHSSAILQDDSGIPYQFFQPATWKIQLYGSYDRPYGSFRYLEQPDLRNAYQTLAVKPLGFRIGYGFSAVPSNLLLASRRARQPEAVRSSLDSVQRVP